MTGSEFKALRRAMGLSQVALAVAMGQSKRSIIRIEARAEVGKTDELAVRKLADDFERAEPVDA